MVTVGAAATDAGARLAELLRDRLPALRLTANVGAGSFRSQMKRADRSGAQIAIVVGDEEVAHERFGLKELRTDSPQLTLSAEDTVLRLAQAIEAG
jgi:histidyl-tRNA synthetase